MREIIAAWACCGLVVFGAFPLGAGGGRDDPKIAVYAGVHIPAGGGPRTRSMDDEDSADDDTAGDIGAFSAGKGPLVCSRHTVAGYSKTQSSPASSPPRRLQC
jgi:hypothetical protein